MYSCLHNKFVLLFQVGCRSEDECSPSQSCINNECIDSCLITQCGISAQCKSDGYHRANCYCPEGFYGNPYDRCQRPECSVDDECASFLACHNNRCVDPCNCPLSAQCLVVNHRPSCRCATGFTGNPYESCEMGKFFSPFYIA